jgi:hypothetical protein
VDFSKGFGGKESRGGGSLEADAGVGDPELYENVLGLRQPWQVQAVQLDIQNKSVEVTVGCEPGTLWASAAGARLPVHDHVGAALAASAPVRLCHHHLLPGAAGADGRRPGGDADRASGRPAQSLYFA